VATDVTDSESVRSLAQAAVGEFGVGGGGLIKNEQLVDWKWITDVSLWGIIHGIHHFWLISSKLRSLMS
jgi:hypothetical protein